MFNNISVTVQIYYKLKSLNAVEPRFSSKSVLSVLTNTPFACKSQKSLLLGWAMRLQSLVYEVKSGK